MNQLFGLQHRRDRYTVLANKYEENQYQRNESLKYIVNNLWVQRKRIIFAPIIKTF